MHRTCKLLRLNPLFLFLLACTTSRAQQSQTNVSGSGSLTHNDPKTYPAEVRATSEPRRLDHTPTDSTSSEIGAIPSLANYYFYEPYPMEVGSSFWQLGLSVSLVPLAEAEQEYPMPGLDVQYKRGLFKNVSYVASLSTSWYSWLFHTGLQWNSNLDRFSYGIANHFGFAYGYMHNTDVFENVVAYGYFYMPMLRFGYRFDDFSLSCSLVMTYAFKATSRVNGTTAYVGPEKKANDLYCTWVVEQPFLRNLQLSVGLSIGYARTPYQPWMQYNTTDEWLFVPEFFFAVQL